MDVKQSVIILNVNVDKLDCSKFIKGEKGVYVDLVCIPAPNSQYSSHIVVQGTKDKKDREGLPAKRKTAVGSVYLPRMRAKQEAVGAPPS